jgi:hypothetical protein
MYQESLESYKQARAFARNYLGEEDSIYKNLNEVYLKAKTELEKHMQKQKAKEIRSTSTNEKSRAVSAARAGRN